jgi:hypothetical protein
MTIQSPVNDKQEKNAGNFTEEDTKSTEFFRANSGHLNLLSGLLLELKSRARG